MIFSKSKKFIFIHIAKNGGSSIEKALGSYGIKGLKRTALNELLSKMPYQRLPEQMVHPPHVDANWIRTRVGSKVFDNMFSFAIVRNPFDQMVSRFEYIKKSKHHNFYKAANNLEFGDFLQYQKWRDWNFTKTQFSKLTDRNGTLIVSKVYRFENFQNILADVSAILGIDDINSIPHENATEREPYQDYYSDKSRKFVEKNFRIDLEYFDYKF